MSYPCEMKSEPARPAISIRTRTKIQELPGFLGMAYGRLAQYLGQIGEAPAGPPYTGYFNMDMGNLEVEAGFPVSRPLPGQGDIQSTEIPAGKIARCVYQGPYDGISLAYKALTQWIQEHGYEATGVAYEMYLNDPQQVPPAELQTLIMFPLR